jgi:hypothetical protein
MMPQVSSISLEGSVREWSLSNVCSLRLYFCLQVRMAKMAAHCGLVCMHYVHPCDDVSSAGTSPKPL